MVWAILLIFGLEYIRPAMLFPPLRAIPLNSLVPLGTYFYSLTSSKNPTYRFFGATESKYFIAFLVLIGMGYFTAPLTLYVHSKFEAVTGYLIVYFLLTKEIKDSRRMWIFLTGFLGIQVALIFLNMDLFLKGDRSGYITSGSFLGDGNDFSLAMNVAFPLALFFVFNSRSKIARIFAIICSCLLVLGIVGVVSRGGILGLASVVVYYIIRSRRFALGIVLIVALLLVIGFFASDLLYDRMGTISNYEEDGSAMGRILAWKAAVNMMKDNPLTGVGPGHFALSYYKYRVVDYGRVKISPHSFYFQLIGEMGIPGIAVYVALLFTAFRTNTRYVQMAKKAPESGRLGNLFLFLNMSWVGYLIAGAFLSTAYYPHVFVLTGLSVAARNCFDAWSKDAAGEDKPESLPSRRTSQRRTPEPARARRPSRSPAPAAPE